MITWLRNMLFGKDYSTVVQPVETAPAPVVASAPVTTEEKNTKRRAATEKLVAKTKAPRKPRNTKKAKIICQI